MARPSDVSDAGLRELAGIVAEVCRIHPSFPTWLAGIVERERSRRRLEDPRLSEVEVVRVPVRVGDSVVEELMCGVTVVAMCQDRTARQFVLSIVCSRLRSMAVAAMERVADA